MTMLPESVLVVMILRRLFSVDYDSHVARITAGNGPGPGWNEDIAWKSDINTINQTISALQQTVQSLQNTVNQQATQITGLQTQVNNQANEIKQFAGNYYQRARPLASRKKLLQKLGRNKTRSKSHLF